MSNKIFGNGTALLTCALAVTFCMSSVSCKNKKEEEAQKAEAAKLEQAVPQIPVEVVKKSSATFDQLYPATLRGINDVLVHPQVSGSITDVLVDEGDRVTKGQVLFRLDEVTFQAAVSQAQAQVQQTQAAVNAAKAQVQQAQEAVNAANVQVQLAQTNYDSKNILYKKEIIGETTWKQAKDQLAATKATAAQAQAGMSTAQAAVAQAQAGVEQAQAALTAAQKNLSYTVVTAPSDGIVGSINFREGSYVTPATTLTTVSDNKEMYAYFSLNENELFSLTNNGTRNVEAAIKAMPMVQFILSNGETYHLDGRIATINGVIDQSTGSVTVRALFPNPNGMLLSGARGSVVIPTTFKDEIIIPQAATFEMQDMRMVYVVNDQNIAEPTPIQVEKLSDGKSFVVKAGLEPGQRIVVGGVNTQVRGKMPIKPIQVTEPVTPPTNGAEDIVE